MANVGSNLSSSSIPLDYPSLPSSLAPAPHNFSKMFRDIAGAL